MEETQADAKATSTDTCEHCNHWGGKMPVEPNGYLQWGKCQLFSPIDTRKHEFAVPIIAHNGSMAYLCTSNDFGCKLFVKKA